MEQYTRPGADRPVRGAAGEVARLPLENRQLLRWFPHSLQVWGPRALLDHFASLAAQGRCRLCAERGHPEARCLRGLACLCEALRGQGASEYPPGARLLTLGLGVSEQQALALLRECAGSAPPPRTYRVPPTAAHSIRARCVQTGRALLLVPLQVLPGERAPCNLPLAGYRSGDYLRLTLAGELEAQASGDVNRTGATFTVYHGIWARSGHNAGYWWREWVEMEGGEEGWQRP